MTALVSAASGDWNTDATWVGGVAHPTTGDTATISAGHTITVALGDTATCGAVVLTAGVDTAHRTQLTINGTYNVGGLITFAGNQAFNLGPGSILDLNGFEIRATIGDLQYNFAGSSGSHVTIQSTGTRGFFNYTGAVMLISAWTYVDISGLADSYFARGNGNAGIQSYQNCTFTNMQLISLEDVNNTADGGILLSRCDFRDPFAHNTAYQQPMILMNSTEIGANVREVSNCTWSSSGNIGYTNIRARGTTFKNNVVANYRSAANSTATQIWQDSFFKTSAGDLFSQAVTYIGILTFQRNYCYYDGIDHPFSNFFNTTVTQSIFESPFGASTYDGINWFLNGTTARAGQFSRNILMGCGEFLTATGGCDWTGLACFNNTFYMNNGGLIETGSKPFGSILGTEQSGLISGSPQFYNNLVLEPVSSNNPRDAAIALIDATADQIGICDYNVCWSYNGSLPVRPLGATPNYYYQVTITGGTGSHDFATDPRLVDKNRNLAAWDTSLGGPGTAAHAIAEMLKLNGTGGTWDLRYNPVALVAWVSAGFVPQNTALRGTGLGGADIGAMTVVPRTTKRIPLGAGRMLPQ